MLALAVDISRLLLPSLCWRKLLPGQQKMALETYQPELRHDSPLQKMVFYQLNQIVCSCVLALTVQSLLQIRRFPQAGLKFCEQKGLLDALRAFLVWTWRAATSVFPVLQVSCGAKAEC